VKIRELEPKQKIIIVSIIVVFISLIVLLFLLLPKNGYGSGISVNNYDKYIKNLPTDRKNSINSALYKIVATNSQTDNINVNDATIRDGSAKYSYDRTTNVNSGSFIVDMESIKQSYMISYEWSSDSKNSNLSGYSAIATCLASADFIYGEFGCVDSFANSKSYTERDPILKYLPYSTFNLSVTANVISNDRVDLNVNIILYSSDTRDGQRDISIAKYKTEIVEWIRSLGLNPDDYLIIYSIK
jgi:hypothetical protein